jgi:hypothetical protein
VSYIAWSSSQSAHFLWASMPECFSHFKVMCLHTGENKHPQVPVSFRWQVLQEYLGYCFRRRIVQPVRRALAYRFVIAFAVFTVHRTFS